MAAKEPDSKSLREAVWWKEMPLSAYIKQGKIVNPVIAKHVV